MSVRNTLRTMKNVKIVMLLCAMGWMEKTLLAMKATEERKQKIDVNKEVGDVKPFEDTYGDKQPTGLGAFVGSGDKPAVVKAAEQKETIRDAITSDDVDRYKNAPAETVGEIFNKLHPDPTAADYPNPADAQLEKQAIMQEFDNKSQPAVAKKKPIGVDYSNVQVYKEQTGQTQKITKETATEKETEVEAEEKETLTKKTTGKETEKAETVVKPKAKKPSWHQALSNKIKKQIDTVINKLSGFEDRIKNASTLQEKKAVVSDLKNEENGLKTLNKQTSNLDEKANISNILKELMDNIANVEKEDPILNQDAKKQSQAQIESLKAELAARKSESAQDIEFESVGSGRLTDEQVRGALVAKYKTLIELENDETQKAEYEKEMKAVTKEMIPPRPKLQTQSSVFEVK